MVRSRAHRCSVRRSEVARPLGPLTRIEPSPKRIASLLGICFFVVYASRLCPSLCLTGDSAELVTASAIWGVPHSPGYPLFTVIGHAFASIPLGSVPWRIHLTSAFFHATTVGVVAWTTFIATRSRLAVLASGWALGSSHTFFLGSLYAEVFPMNDLLFAILLALAMSEHVRRDAQGPRTRFGRLVAFAAILGLALGHHPMIALAIPSLAVLMARPIREAIAGDARRAASLVTALCIPVCASYALVPLAAARSPYLSWGDVHDVPSLLALILRSDYGGPFSAAHHPSAEPWTARLWAFGKLVDMSAGTATLAVAAFGLGDRLRGARTVGVSLLVAAALSGPLFACANAIGTGSEVELAYFERFTSMCHVPLAVAFGTGIAALTRMIGESRAAMAVGGVALVTWMGWIAFRANDVTLRGDGRAIAYAHDLVLSTPPHSLILLTGDEPADAALYVCAVERGCGDRVVLSPGTLFLPWRMAQFRRRHPEVDIPWSNGPALARIHELVAAEAPKRPVFVHPDLFTKDPLLSAFAHFPDGLLFRTWASGSDPEPEREAFRASARALARGDCEGCRPSAIAAPAPSQEVQIVEAYESAFVDHARAANAWDADLARGLEDRAREMSVVLASHGGGESMSR